MILAGIDLLFRSSLDASAGRRVGLVTNNMVTTLAIAEMPDGLVLLRFEIPDIGARFYT